MSRTERPVAVSHPLEQYEAFLTQPFEPSYPDSSDLQAIVNRLTGMIGALTDERGFEVFCGLLVPTLADWCTISLVSDGPDGIRYRRISIVHRDPAKTEFCKPLIGADEIAPGDPGLMAVLRTGRPLLQNAVDEAPLTLLRQRSMSTGLSDQFARQLGVSSCIVVPLLSRFNTVGALGLYFADANRRYTTKELEFAESIASILALAAENLRLRRSMANTTRERDEILAMVSHDLKSPLSAVTLATSFIRKILSEGKTDGIWLALRSLDNICSASEQMGRLIRNILDITRIDAHRFSIERAPCDPVALINETVKVFRPLAFERQIQFEVCCDDRCGSVFGDRIRIQQLLSNLVGNAIKYGRIAGRVEIRVEPPATGRLGQELQFTVKDNGPGIPERDVPYIFDRFWSAKKNAKLGTGLGLAIAKGIVEAHGGRIWVESRLEQGTAFHFTLPAVSNPCNPSY